MSQVPGPGAVWGTGDGVNTTFGADTLLGDFISDTDWLPQAFNAHEGIVQDAHDLTDFPDDIIAASLAAFSGKDVDELPLSPSDFSDDMDDSLAIALGEKVPSRPTGTLRAAFSMNDLQSLQMAPQPQSWNPRLVSIKPSLESVPEGAPSHMGAVNLFPMPNSYPMPAYPAAAPGQAPGPAAALQAPPAMTMAAPPAPAPAPMPEMHIANISAVPCDHLDPDSLDDLFGPPAPTLNRSLPSAGTLSAQMNNQLQLKSLGSEGNLQALDDPTNLLVPKRSRGPRKPQGIVKPTAPTMSVITVPSNPTSPAPSYTTTDAGSPGPASSGEGYRAPPHVAPQLAAPGAPGLMGMAPGAHVPAAPVLPPLSQGHSFESQSAPPVPPAAPPVPPAAHASVQPLAGPSNKPPVQYLPPSGAPLRKAHSALELNAWRGMQGMDGDVPDAKIMLGLPPMPGMEGIKIGKLTPEERMHKILRYRAKRHLRNFNRSIKYQCRKSLADTRPRVRGRFARNDDPDSVMPHETKKAMRERLAREAAMAKQQAQQQHQAHQQQVGMSYDMSYGSQPVAVKEEPAYEAAPGYYTSHAPAHAMPYPGQLDPQHQSLPEHQPSLEQLFNQWSAAPVPPAGAEQGYSPQTFSSNSA